MSGPGIRALTLHQPWAWAIAEGHKRVENRGWRPPTSALGGWLAIHAGKTHDEDAAYAIESEFGFDVPGPGVIARGAIVAVGRLAHVVTSADELPPDQRSWFVGEYGWVLEEVVRIEPIPCRGAQGLWPVPEEVLPVLRERFAAAKAGAR